MKKSCRLPYVVSLLMTCPSLVFAMGDANPLLTTLKIDQLEIREADGSNPRVWDASLAMGYDLNKVWLTTEGERVDGETESAEVSLLYGRAIAPYWDVLVGLRQDLQPDDPQRQWLQLGVQGTAPYFIETEVSLFVGESGRTALRIELEQEWRLAQRWLLVPELEADIYGHNDVETGVGSGLANIELGLRLFWEVRREFSPYVGVVHEKSFGNTAAMVREEGGEVSDTQLVLGVSAWF